MPPTQCAPHLRIDPDELRRLRPGLLKLAAYWHVKCRLDASREPEDLLQQAIASLYAGASWPAEVTLKRFLKLKIKQIATTARRQEVARPQAPAFELTLLRAPVPNSDARVRIARTLDRLTMEVGHRAELAVLRCWRLGLTEANEIRERTGLTTRRIKTVRQRLAKIARSLEAEEPSDRLADTFRVAGLGVAA
ncbi:MAG: hypothetical protein HYV07_21510 [Deltaproteobacteria bacterium]|nr:hypothetical protein [Deltaproteobacteria bacterium]